MMIYLLLLFEVKSSMFSSEAIFCIYQFLHGLTLQCYKNPLQVFFTSVCVLHNPHGKQSKCELSYSPKTISDAKLK